MKNTILFSGFNSQQLGSSVAQKLQIPFGKLETAQFADGEIRVRILDEVKGKDVLILQSFYPKTNTAIMQFCFIINTLRENGAKRIFGIVPYLGYARQDKAHRVGEAVSSAAIAKILESTGLNRLLTCDIHSLDVLNYFGIPAENISALSLIVSHITKDLSSSPGLGHGEDIILISPDQDGAKRVKRISQLLNIDHGFVQKERDLETTDKLKQTHGQDVSGDVNGKDVILLDDMISTGASLLIAAKKLKNRGAKRIFAGAAHGIFAKDPSIVFKDDLIEKVVVTDTIRQDNKFEKLDTISVADLLADYINTSF